jgi:hypothetical protein
MAKDEQRVAPPATPANAIDVTGWVGATPHPAPRATFSHKGRRETRALNEIFECLSVYG